MQRILGIDPGFGRVGWGIIEGKGAEWKAVDFGCIETSPKDSFVDRLIEIDTELKKIIRKCKPNSSAVEELFFYKNVTTAIQVGQARGVILLTLTQANLKIIECTPLQVKQTIVGYGRAEKSQVQSMIAMQLGLKKQKIQDDAADALAIALTGALMAR